MKALQPDKLLLSLRQQVSLSRVGHVLAGTIALAAAIATVKQPNMVRLLEAHVQTSFFDIRGAVAPPGSNPDVPGETGIVILAMDGDSMTQGTQIYPTAPQQYAHLASIARWPWQRTAYAIAIDRVMQAGARAVVVDVVLDTPSSYGTQDDTQLQQVLQKYAGRVALAAQWENGDTQTGGNVVSLLLPNPTFRSADPAIGVINFPTGADGRIHELGSEFPQQLAQTRSDLLAQEILQMSQETPSLAEAGLQASQLPYPTVTGQKIFFYGPKDTFPQVPFWHVLDPTNWNNLHVKNQTFKNKIVLIGPTAGGGSLQDFHTAPFSGTLLHPEKMAGVEIQANAIATLLEGKSIAQAVPNLIARGVLVLLLVLVAAYLQNRNSRLLRRFGYGVVLALAWGAISYVVFVQGRLIVPTAVPMLAIVFSSTAYLFTGVAKDKLNVRKLGKWMVGSPDFQSAVSEVDHTDLQQIVERHHQEFIGSKLDRRYKILDLIGAGGFGETYIAEDIKRPGNPHCVVKRLKPTSKNPKVMKMAEGLFKQEAEVLERLGKHNQIPQLLAYFEENDDFYLVQEYVEGSSLADELKMRSLPRRLSEYRVIVILYDLLQTLDFVHQQGVIHRDIKPGNVIQRKSDGRLVLIDFGAVKQITKLEEGSDVTNLTVAIGTNGYIAPEQAHGRPCLASDIYSLGILGIQALTGILAPDLEKKRDKTTQELRWKAEIPVSQAFAEILDTMVQFKLTERYRSARDVLEVLDPLVDYAQKAGLIDVADLPVTAPDSDGSEAEETKLWHHAYNSIGLPPTDPIEVSGETGDKT